MPKTRSKSFYVCQSCGVTTLRWLGRCPDCGEWDSLVEERTSDSRPQGRKGPAKALSVPFPEVRDETGLERWVTGNPEFDRVLGGGIVPGSVALLGGEPGIGKSTLLLQISEVLSLNGLRLLYVAGEESLRQIKMRGDRLGISGERLFLSNETCVERVVEEAGRIEPDFMIIDSIQTVSSESLDSVPGSIGQIREGAIRFLEYAKQEGVACFLIGHITKEGSLAGPKALEHIVDVVLYFEGDRHQNQKLVRTVKNRFGASNELGIFEMTSRGLRCVENPSELFLSERAEEVPGSVVLGAIHGSRPVLVELQALVSQSSFSTAKRMATGLDPNRLSLLLAMLEKRLGVHLLGSDVYVNVAGGLSLSEPALDLALVAAVISSFRDLPLAQKTVVFGEVGLAGEVRAVSHPQVRIKEARSMGFERVILPRGNLPLAEPIDSIRLDGVASVPEFLELVEFWSSTP